LRGVNRAYSQKRKLNRTLAGAHPLRPAASLRRFADASRARSPPSKLADGHVLLIAAK